VGRLTAHIWVTNLLEPGRVIECDALVDTGSAHLVFPIAWQERLGKLNVAREIECVTATQQTARGQVCGPVEIRIEGFAPVFGEVLFLDMAAKDGHYEPLIGHIPLEASQAAVDMLGHRLLHVKTVDLKPLGRPGF